MRHHHNSHHQPNLCIQHLQSTYPHSLGSTLLRNHHCHKYRQYKSSRRLGMNHQKHYSQMMLSQSKRLRYNTHLRVHHHMGNSYMKRCHLGTYHHLHNRQLQYRRYNLCQYSKRRRDLHRRLEQACRYPLDLNQQDQAMTLSCSNYYQSKIGRVSGHSNHLNHLDNRMNHNKVDRQLDGFRHRVGSLMSQEPFDLHPS